MCVMRGNLISLEPLDVAKHTAGYFEISLDENIHRYTGNGIILQIVLLISVE